MDFEELKKAPLTSSESKDDTTEEEGDREKAVPAVAGVSLVCE